MKSKLRNKILEQTLGALGGILLNGTKYNQDTTVLSDLSLLKSNNFITHDQYINYNKKVRNLAISVDKQKPKVPNEHTNSVFRSLYYKIQNLLRSNNKN